MPITPVLWPDAEVGTSVPACTCETPIQIKSAPEAFRKAPRLTEARLGEALLEGNRIPSASRLTDALGTLLLHTALLAGIFLLPLWYTDALDLRSYTHTLLVGPPPPPPPPPAPVAVKTIAASHRNLFSSGKLLAPVAIPKQIVIIKEEPIPAEVDFGGVPGGVPGGQLGGVIGGILGGVASTRAPAPLAEKLRAPVRVGGHVRAPQPVYKPSPTYPPLARQARIQGDVVIDAVIDKSGAVVEMKVLSGPPVLIPAALAAVRSWRYQPTFLNDEPIDVQFIVTVHFELQS